MPISARRNREAEDRIKVARSQPHRRSAKSDEEALDHRQESEIGRANLKGKITESEYNAAKKWQEIVLKYIHSIGAPNPFSITGDWEMGHTIGAPGETNLSDDECKRRKENYDAAFIKLMSGGNRVAKSVSRIIIYDEPYDDFAFECMKIGLKILSDHFYSGPPRKIIPFSEFKVSF